MACDSILILGAGLMQRPAIMAAKECGLTVYVVDANPKAVCVADADFFEPVDLKDREGIAAYALKLKAESSLRGIFTAGTDFSASVAYAAEKCSLPGHSYSAACNANSKHLMRQCFRKYGAPSPEFITVDKDSAASIINDDFVKSMSYPCVVKPVDNMGARGCRMVRSADELPQALEDAAGNSRTGTAILEEYMDGPEYSIDALIFDGTMTITGFADRHIYYPPYFIEMGHTMPTDISRDKFKALAAGFASGVAALGLTCGVAKADIKYTEKGPMIGEIAARLSGGYMSGWTYPYSSGFNLTKAALQLSVGMQPDEALEKRVKLDVGAPFEMYEIPSGLTSAERAWISIPGKVRCIYGLDEARASVGIKDVLPISKEGACVVFPRNNVEKCGNIISLGNTRDEAVLYAHDAVRKITMRLEAGNPETRAFLDSDPCLSADSYPPSAYQLPDFVLKAFSAEVNETDVIPAGKRIIDSIPAAFSQPSVLDMEDWNHISFRDAVNRFDSLCPDHKELSASDFWRSFIKGGLQGALYENDC